MRTTINIDKRLLEEALKLTNARTKKELINLSLKEFVRRRHLEKLKKRLGKCDLNLNLSSLEEMRKDE
ncbi:MAG: type II toxin-antitoxin system VapB family antitoxin [Candidatus Atribacteria bacterium]|nr:type II toxin-antitoxin system VapB family antitoxin [Candidatus Atribacteria bacterium]